VIMKKEANSRVREYSYTAPCVQFLHAHPSTLWLVVAPFEIRTLFNVARTQPAPITQRLYTVGSCSFRTLCILAVAYMVEALML
jgi:hypothetical protein